MNFIYGGHFNLSSKVTSRDVAKAAGVSQSLVSLILNNVQGKKIKSETRELVIETAERLNYKVNINARSMKNKKAGAIGLLSTWKANTFVFPYVIEGVKSVSSKNESGIVICTGKKRFTEKSDYVDYFLENRIDGLIYVSYVGVGREGVIEELENNNIPFVCVIGARDIREVSCVDVDFRKSGYMAGKHLADMGYKSVAYLSGISEGDLIYAEKERYEGCKRFMAENGMKIQFIDVLKGTEGEKNMIMKAEELLKNRSFDAVVSTSYICFIVLKACANSGVKVPDELGVISLDNELYAPYLYPSLTTIDEPLFEIAIKASSVLFEKINGRNICVKEEIPPLISVRESTGRHTV
jgi:LacI family transcriptional regulator